MQHTSNCYLSINGGTEENQSQLIWPRCKQGVSQTQEQGITATASLLVTTQLCHYNSK